MDEEREARLLDASDITRRAEVTYRGVELRIRRRISTGQTTAGNTVRRWTCWLSTPLGAPAMCLVIGSPKVRELGAALKTGDATFDAALRVAGAPRAFVLAGLDAGTRQRLVTLAAYRVGVRSQTGERVVIRVTDAVEEGRGHPELLRSFVDTLLGFVAGVRAEVGRQHAAAAAGGEQAVHAWVERRRAEVNEYRAAKGHLRGLLLYLVVLGIFFFLLSGGCLLVNYAPSFM